MTLLTSWLLTYLIHSTLLLGGAALLSVALGGRRLGLQEAVLRAALVGSFVTASLQLGLGIQPLGGVFALPEEAAIQAHAEPGAIEGDAVAPGKGELVFGSLPSVLEKVRRRDDAAPASRWSFPAPSVWKPGLTGLWATVALLALARMAVAAVRLRRLLRPRHPLPNEDLAARANALARRLGLRRRVPLSTAPRLEVPLATGVVHPEVCLPTRALDELEGEQQVALCAHELAHVARRDPTWILAARLAEAAVPIQPLNAWARRRLQDLAECLSDDLAVAASGRPLGLARSLVDVASWTVAEPIPLPAASGALSTRSRLGHRVERLMDPLRSLERPRRILLPLAAVAVLATALVTPVVSGHPALAPEPPAAAEPHAAPAAPAAPVAPVAAAPPSAPAAPAAPEAPPAPEAPEALPAPEAPEAPPAPEAPASPKSDAAERLEELTRAIEERVEGQQGGLAEMEAEIEALVRESLPDHGELTRLGLELEVAARALAEARRHAEHEGTGSDEEIRQDVEEARRQMEEARARVHETAHAIRIPEEERERIQKMAREIARAARPTVEEREEMRRLAQEIARESVPDMSELHAEMRRLGREFEGESFSHLGETMAEMGERLREMMSELSHGHAEASREAARAAREVAREAARAARESARDAAREARESAREAAREAARAERERARGLEEAEESHLEETSKEESETEQP